MVSTTWLSELPSRAAAWCAADRSVWSILIVRCGRYPFALASRRCGNGGGGSQFPHRREASANGYRPHLTIKIDHTLRSAAHQAAAREGNSLSQVVETILDRYLRHGLAGEDQPPASRPARRSR